MSDKDLEYLNWLETVLWDETEKSYISDFLRFMAAFDHYVGRYRKNG